MVRRSADMVILGTIVATGTVIPSTARAQVQAAQALEDRARVVGSEASEAIELEIAGDIVVTAQRRSESAQKVPIAISAVEGADLARANIRRSEDLSIRVPSLTIGNDSNIGQPYIRGIGSQYSFPGLDPSVALYVNGAYVQRQAGSILEFVDVQNVQVLKGPQGTLYGRNATGGAILVQTSLPKLGATEGYLSTEFGRFNDWRTQAVLNMPLGADMAIRVAGQHRQRDGFIFNRSTGLDEGGGNSDLLRGTVLWEPAGSWSVTATGEYFGDKGSYGSLRERLSGTDCTICTLYGYVPPTDFYTVDGLTNETRSRGYSGTLKVAYEGDTIGITSISGYRDTRFSARNDNDFSAPNFINSLLIERGKTFTQEIQAVSTFDGAVNFLLGANYENDRAEVRATFGGDAFAALPPIGTFNRVKLDSYSIYGEAYVDLAADWRLTGGLRYNSDNKRLAVENSPGGALFGGSGLTNFATRRRFTDLTQRAVIAYTPGRANYYASYNKGFKSGGFNTPTFAPVSSLDPELIDSVEVGAKNAFLGGRLRTDLALFYYWYNDLQVSRVNFNTGGIESQNAASARTFGAEGSFDFRVTTHLSIGVAATYLHARFRDFPDAAAFVRSPGGVGLANAAVNLSDTRLPYSPKVAASIYATYRADLGDGWSSELSGTLRHSGSYDFAPGANGPLRLDRQDALTLVNLTASIISPDRLRLGLYVNNLTNKRYFASAVTAVYAAEYHPAAPRTYGASIRYDF